MAREGMRVERVTIAVVVARYDVVVDATGAFENGWKTCGGIALVVYGYARPAEKVAGAVQRMSSVGSHALCSGMRGHDFAPVSFDGGGHEGLGVGKHALASKVS